MTSPCVFCKYEEMRKTKFFKTEKEIIKLSFEKNLKI